MNKITKIILLILIITILSFVGFKIYTLAYDIDAYMDIFGSWDGKTYTEHGLAQYVQQKNDYLTGSEEYKKGLLNKSVGFPDVSKIKPDCSEYNYVSDYSTLWCLSEGEINETAGTRLRIYGIIEIGKESNPTYTTIYYLDDNLKPTIKRGVSGEGEERRAQSAFTMKSGSYKTITHIAQRNFYDTYASFFNTQTYLKKFYDADIPRGFNTEELDADDSSYTYDKYANAVVAINEPIYTDVFKDLKCSNSDAGYTTSGDSEKWSTKIEPKTNSTSKGFNMSSNSSLITYRKMILTKADGGKLEYDIKKSGSYWCLYNGNTKVGRIVVSNGGKICLKDKVQITNVEIKVGYKYIHGILYMIGGTATQTRGVSKGEWKVSSKTNSVNITTTTTPVTNTSDVSMQKYVNFVNGVSLGGTNKINARACAKTDTETETNKGLLNGTTFRQPAKGSAYEVRSLQKYDEPVSIKLGDKVTYRIGVYNNGTTTAKNITIEDRLPYIYESKGKVSVTDEDGNTVEKTKKEIITVAEVTSITLGKANDDIIDQCIGSNESKQEDSDYVYTGKFKRIAYTIPELAAGENTYILVTLSFNTKVANGKILTNTALVKCDGNNTVYRTVDRDYVEFTDEYKVSLEKFISKVNNTSYTDRNADSEATAVSTYRFNPEVKDDTFKSFRDGYVNVIDKASSEQTNNYHFKKYNEAVPVKSGDKVTFTIRLRNTGTLPVKVTQLYDSFNVIEENKYAGIKLEYDSTTGITGNGGGRVADNHYGGDDENANWLIDRYLIAFDNPTTIAAGSYVDVKIAYTVKVASAPASKELRLNNKARIAVIENENNMRVTDSDGAANNTDIDFVKISSKYAVSLEKYVSEVNTEAKAGRDGHPTYETKGFIKADNPVGVEKQDEVNYTIKLTNTGKNAASYGRIYKVEISDVIPSHLQYESCGNATSGSVTYNGSGKFTWTGTLEVGSSIEFTIKCTVKNSVVNNAKIENTAEITNIYDIDNKIVTDSDGTDNNKDSDWIRIKYTAVALEKYVTRVDSKDGFVEYNNRSGKRYNGNLDTDTVNPSEDNPNLHPYKYESDNRVKVEKGDIVTFTIELQNTGEVPVKVTRIYDTFWSYSDGTKLKYVEGSISGNGEVYDIDYNEGSVASDHEKIDFKFKNVPIIEPGKSEKVTVKFEVVSTRTGRTSLKNRAGITHIADKNGDHNSAVQIHDNSNIRNYDFDGSDNNYDNDYVKIQRYEVRLQKIVYSVNDVKTDESRWDSWESTANRIGENIKDESGYTISEVSNKDNRYYKYNNPVTVANGDKVVYAIKVTNNGTTKVKDIKIKDTLPSGLESVRIENTESSNKTEVTYVDYNKSENVITFRLPKVLEAGESNIIYISAIVTKSNLSTEVLRNYAEITGDMKNKNDISVYDYTGRNNDDADYIQMKDITISGVVWNDKAFDKANTYNGIYDDTDDKEKGLDGVTVKLYRTGIASPIATTKTVNGGKYTFTSSDIDSSVIEEKCNRFIKGPYRCQDSSYDASNVHSANYWKGDYYSYYVVFEYDGITYTSTIYSDFGSGDDRELSSNAREKLDNESFDGKVNQSRTDFNSRYDKINGDGAFRKYIEGNSTWNGKHNKTLTYDTVNKAGYIPSSIFNLQKSFERSVNYQMRENGLSYEQACIAAYNDNMLTILMSSSTKKIDISENINLEEQLQHVNLGLRGRDIFDLELTSDVEKVEVTVNDQVGKYQHSNKVNLRRSDIEDNLEDMANKVNEPSNNTYVDSIDQKIRNSDINVTSGYEDEQGLSKIQVTYKITVQNASKTDGTATKITNYYDKCYKVNSDSKKVAYYYATDEDKNKDKNRIWLNTVNDTSNGEYNSILITTPGTNLTQSETMEIYVVYTLNNPRETLKILQVGEKLPTYNMAEITEYRTKCGAGQTEFTRGLIDKDSAPGSVNKEQVRLTTTEGQNTPTIDGDKDGNKTTVQYYFGENDLTKLKYEDDTYATPTLYFVNDGTNIRTITGTVFEDKTTIDQVTKIKTGNGKFKLDEGEVGVYGATVQLIELKQEDKNEEKIKERKQVEVDGKYYPVRYSTLTVDDDSTTTENELGTFEFKDFLPGKYIIIYRYGNTYDTTLKYNKEKESGDKVNKKSYNGEDFQATNNTGKVDGSYKEELYELNGEPNYWYLYNETEGISAAFDNVVRRSEVSNNVTNFTDEQMTVLNNMRDGKDKDASSLKDELGNEIANASVDCIIEKTNMFAETKEMIFTVEKSEIVEDTEGRDVFVQKTAFSEYNITNMNFGIAEVPVSIVDLQKDVKGFILKDSTGKNIIASISKKEDGTWDITGDVIDIPNDQIYVSVENEKLQGARLEITYTISATIDTQINYDGKSCVVPQISGIVDFVNNNLSYNPDLGNNKEYWKITSSADLTNFLKAQKFGEGTAPKGMVDPDGNTYSTVLMATYGNPLIGLASGSASVDITLEAVLASTDMTLEQIITSTIDTDTSEYSNIVEIIGFKYHPNHPTDDFKPEDKDDQDVPKGEDSKNEGFDPMRDRVRTPGTDSNNRDNGYIIIPGVQYDYATSGTVVVTTPTGTTAIDTVYYIVALVGLGILAAGVYGIKKFVTKK